MLFLDGAYVDDANGSVARFQWVKAPTSEELTRLTHQIALRIGRFLERRGVLVRDAEDSYLTSDAVDEDLMQSLVGHSITYRIAVGPHAGRKVFTLQTLPACDEPDTGKVAGFSLHAGVAAKADERKKLERLCRYIARPAVSEKRLSLTSQGQVRYELKTPYRDGTTHVIFEPLDFIAKLAALVPKPADMIKIKARDRWNDTEFDLETGGVYHFSSRGTWVDWLIPCHADGYSSLFYMRSYRNKLRMPEARWFSLIGEIGQNSVVQIDIGDLIVNNAPYKVEQGGRLYCYANDIPSMYWNNWGSVRLTISRVEDAD